MQQRLVMLIGSLIVRPLALAAPGLSIALAFLGGPYRVLAYRPPAFGGVTAWLLTWLGIAAGFPLIVTPWLDVGDRMTAIWFWVVLAVLAYIQMFARWCSEATHDPTVGHSWVGGKAEPVLAVALAGTAAMFCGGGGAWFILAGYACSMSQIWLSRLRLAFIGGKLDGLFIPTGTLAREAASAAFVRGTDAKRKARSLAVLSGRLILAAWFFLMPWAGRLRAMTARPETPEGQANGHVYQRPSFMRSVMSHLVAHFILLAIGGTVVIKAFGFVLAIVLLLIGWKVEAPTDVKEDAHGFLSRTWGMFGAKAEEAKDHLRHEKDEAIDRFRHRFGRPPTIDPSPEPRTFPEGGYPR